MRDFYRFALAVIGLVLFVGFVLTILSGVVSIILIALLAGAIGFFFSEIADWFRYGPPRRLLRKIAEFCEMIWEGI